MSKILWEGGWVWVSYTRSGVYEMPARPWARTQKLKTPDSGYEPSFGTGTRMRGYGNVGSNDLHIYLGWPAHLLSS